jgi:hypothetical protein
MSARALEERGIYLKRWQPGEHRAPCPECRKGNRDDALAVKIDYEGGATWVCHRCQWSGGIGARNRTERPPVRRRPRPDPIESVHFARWARRLWCQCEPIRPGTPAATYLERRGCALPPEDGDLRWYFDAPNKREGYSGPALVGLVTDAISGEAINLHRTWLTRDGSSKAPLEKPRLLLPRHSAKGVIRLWPEVLLGLTIGEGVETCLAAARAGLTPAWATISAGNLAEFPVLPGLEGLIILVDHDRPNPKTGKRAGTEAARSVIRRYADAGLDPARDIQVIMSPREGEDAADLEAA